MFRIDWEPFNGVARRPWLMFIGLILSIIVWAAIVILCVVCGYNITSENETMLVETSFVAYSVEKEELHFSAANRNTYTILSYKYYDGKFDDPSSFCCGDTYTIWVTEKGYIRAMNDAENRQIITFESEREAYRDSQKLAVVLMVMILSVYIAFFVLALVISKNSERYPVWLVKILFAQAPDFWT